MSQPPTGDPTDLTDSAGSAVVTRSEERARVTTERVVTGGVRLVTRVVTEERTLTVTVRREELVVEPLVGAAQHSAAPTAGHGDEAGGVPVLDLVLSEEQVEVVTRVVPVERVRVFVDRVDDVVDVEQSLRREVVDVESP